MPDDHSSRKPCGPPNPLAGTGLEEFADPPGYTPHPMRWVLQGGFGNYRELPPQPEQEGAHILRAMLRSLRRRSQPKPGESRTE